MGAGRGATSTLTRFRAATMSRWAVLAGLAGLVTAVGDETVADSRDAIVEADALGPSLNSLSPNSASSFSAGSMMST